MDYLRGLLGMLVLLGVAYAFSSNRKAIKWKLVGVGILLQMVFGILITQVPLVAQIFHSVSEGFVKFLSFSNDGAKFLFSDMADVPKSGFIFAFQVLPTVIFFSAVTTGLYYLGILQKLSYGIAWLMAKTMGLSGAESLSAAGNIFLGQTEAPLLVRPFIAKMTTSELMCLMTGGMATIAGAVLGSYVAFLGGDDPVKQAEVAARLLSASIMNAPAGIVFAKMLIPETKPELIDSELKVNKETLGANVIDALAIGAGDGLKLALNIGAMLLAFIAVIALLNFMLEVVGDWTTLNVIIAESTGGIFNKLSMEYIFGQVFRVAAFVIGVEWADTLQVGSLLGQKTVINEFVAYVSLADMQLNETISPKSITIATFALCGFSNFSSIAIQIGGIGAMAPNQQANLSRLGLKALLAATLACMMTATIAGALLSQGS